MKKMSLPIRFHDCLSNSASSLQVTTVFHFFGSWGRVLLIFDSFESSFFSIFELKMSYVCAKFSQCGSYA